MRWKTRQGITVHSVGWMWPPQARTTLPLLTPCFSPLISNRAACSPSKSLAQCSQPETATWPPSNSRSSWQEVTTEEVSPGGKEAALWTSWSPLRKVSTAATISGGFSPITSNSIWWGSKRKICRRFIFNNSYNNNSRVNLIWSSISHSIVAILSRL